MGEHASRTKGSESAPIVPGAPGMEAFWEGVAKGSTQSLVDPRVPGTPPDLTALLPYIDRDHDDDPVAMAEKVTAQLTETTARANAFTRAKAQPYVDALIAAMDHTDEREGHHRFLGTLDRLDDPTLRQTVLARFQAQTGRPLSDVIATSDWYGAHDKAQAQALISPARGATERQIAALSPTERAKLKAEARQTATQIADVVSRDSPDDKAHAHKLHRLLADKSPMQIEAIRDAVREQSRGDESLYEQLERSLSGGNEAAAIAALSGDPIYTASVQLEHAIGDAPRIAEILRALKPEQVETLGARFPAARLVWMSVAPDQQGEIRALVTNNRGAADGAKVADLLRDPLHGASADGIQLDEQSKHNREVRSTENILRELEKMTPAQLADARREWDAHAPRRGEKTWDAMIEERFGAGDRLTYMRIRALASGNKVEATALALTQGLRDHDQAAIDAALANPDLSSKDPDNRTAAQDHARAVAARFQEIDGYKQRAIAAMTGGDVASTSGDDLETALAKHYAHVGETQRFDTASDVTGFMLAPDAQAARRKKRARAAEVGTDELRASGSFSTATEIHRARAVGNEERVATILENQTDNTAVGSIEGDYWTKYGEHLFQQLDSEKVGAWRDFQALRGNDISREDAEYALRDSIENRAHAVHTEGPRASRSTEAQLRLDQRERAHQQSDALEANELVRTMVFGRAAGSERRVDWALANEADAVDGPRSEFDQQAAHTRAMSDMQRDEKIAMADRAAQWIAIAGKIAALVTLNPAAMAVIDTLVGFATIYVKGEIQGEAYKTAGADLLDMGITVLNDLAMLPILKIEKALLSTAAMLGLSSGTIIVRNDLTGRAADTTIDLVKNLVLSLVGKGSDKLQDALGGVAGKTVNVLTNAASSGAAYGGDATTLLDAGGGHLAKGKPAKHAHPHDPSAPRVRAPDDAPVRTPHGDIWPLDVPVPEGHPDHAVYVRANEAFVRLSDDKYQGVHIARVAWAQELARHGLGDEGRLDRSRHEVHEHEVPRDAVAPHDGAIARGRAVGERSKNTGRVEMNTVRGALDELMARGSLLAGARRNGDQIEVLRDDGSVWIITIVEPRTTHPDQMAAFSRGEHGDTVWVSNTLTNEEVPAALGAIIGESLARANGRDASRTGELDAMFARRDSVADQVDPTLPDNAKPEQVKAHAHAMSKKESTARIDAEIDLVLARMDMHDVNTREKHLASMPPELAARVRARFAALEINPAAIRHDEQVARPSGTPASHIRVSDVLPPAPAEVRAYGAGDRTTVMELRVELEIIREIDARTAQRDRPGTNGGVEIARGETRRREQHVKRARELMEKLQLGGDSEYIRQRLGELASVFPNAANDIVPAMEQRISRRDSAAESHADAEAFRAQVMQRQAELRAYVASTPVLTTKRLVVGNGFSGLADIATLNPPKKGQWIDPAEMLVIGMADLLELLAAYDPAFRWGQRAATYDRANDAHPAFSDADGHGTKALESIVEDAGDFMRVGEVRDAMDLARQRLGIAAVPGEVRHVETAAERRPDSPPWEVDEQKYPVRAKVVIDGVERFVYAESTDLATGPGKPNMPNEGILSAATRAKLMGEKNGDGALFSGEKLLQGRDVSGKRALVLAFGPTGAWVAKVASNQGAARVDFASGSNRPEAAYNGMAAIDRVQDALDGASNVHVTFDQIVHIEANGDGAIVTYARSPGEDAEVYQVHYDVIVTAMGYSTAYDSKAQAHPIPGEPTVKDMVGDMRMIPQPNTAAPVITDSTGRVRVTGYAAGDAVNVSKEATDSRSDVRELEERSNAINSHLSADSPGVRVVEGVGVATRMSNRKESK